MKSTLQKYGWIVVTVIVVAALIAGGMLFANSIKNGFIRDTNSFTDEMPTRIELEKGVSSSTLINELKTAKDNTTIVLPVGESVDMGAGNLYFLSKALENEDGTGKNITLDLNGGEIVSNTKHSNGYYYGLTVPDGSNLVIDNGALNITTQSSSSSAIVVGTGATLKIKNVSLKSNGACVFPASTASKLVIENSTIEGGSYGIGTNRLESSKIKITLKDSIIKGGYCALLINCASNTTIKDCEIEGAGWAMFVRAGTVNASNTTFKTTDGDVGYNNQYSCSYKNFKYTQNSDGAPYWGEGFQCPYAVVTLGDYSNRDYYSGDAVCTFNNVTVLSPNRSTVPHVLCAAQMADKTVNLNYDNESQIGEVVIFGEDYDYETNGHPEIIHNGTITINGQNQ